MIFNKKEVKNTFNSDEYVTINKKEVDKVLNNKDFSKFIKIFQSIPIGSVLYAVNEKHRLEYLIKKHDLKFIDSLFNFFDKNNNVEDFHKFSDSVYIKSTDKQFAFKKGQLPIEDNLTPHYMASRNQAILKFKRKVIAKVFHYKENPDGIFITQSLDLIKKHDLVDNYIVRKLGSLVVKSNFEYAHNQVIKHTLFNDKRIRKEYLSYVFQASTNIDNLNLIMKNFEEDIRNIFFEKKDNNDFWFDFKITKEKPEEGIPYCYSVRPWSNNTDKLIWLEKHHMGFSNSDTPYYIEFLKHFSNKELDDFLEKVDRTKYIGLFNKSIIEYDQLPSEIKNTKYPGTLDIKSFLLKEMEYTNWGASHDFYGTIKNVILKSELEYSLENKQASRKVKKI